MGNKIDYDAIVIGAGGMGSAAMLALARRGLRVLGVDRYAPPHDRGSSHGQTRIIRQAYFEHPDYVPLVHHAYRAWARLEQLAGEQLLVNTGLLEVGPADGVVAPGVLRAAEQHGLPVEPLDASAIRRRWPAFVLPPGLVGVYEPTAGYLKVEACVAAQLAAAEALGAQLATGVTVLDWQADRVLKVRTTAGSWTTTRLVVTAGPWAGKLLEPLHLQLTVRRKAMAWFRARGEAAGLPAYLFELPEGIFYGFPALSDGLMKVACHSGGVALPGGPDDDLDPPASEVLEVVDFAERCLPTLAGELARQAPCYYTMSPDEHFIVDRWPNEPRIVVAAGLSGHGYKFAPTVGEALADLAIDGQTELPIGFLSLARFSDP